MKEENKLIAEFMGAKPYQDDRYGEMWPDPTANNAYRHGLYYDKSWNWLMLVIEKIKDLVINGYVKDSAASYKLFRLSISAKIETVYEAVIQFITWYNQQPK